MRITSAILQSAKQFTRNRSHVVTIMFGLIISITLISGILYATNSLTNYSVETNLETVPFDIVVDSSTNATTVTNGWNTLEANTQFSIYTQAMYTTTTGLFVSNSPTSNFGGFGGGPTGGSSNNYLSGQEGANIALNSSTPNSTDVFNQTMVLAANMSTYTSLANMGLITLSTNSSTLGDNQVFIDNITATSLGISVGDVIQITTYWSNSSALNETGLTVVGIMDVTNASTLITAFTPNNLEVGTQNETFGGPNGNFIVRTNSGTSGLDSQYIRDIEEGIGSTSFILMNLDSGRQAIANLTSSNSSTFLSEMNYRYVFKLNHNNLPIFNLSELSTTMTYIENQITQNTGITESLTDYITSAVSSIQSDLTIFEVVSLAISVPAIVLGIYLTMTLYGLGLEQRRREFGLMKAHGANSKDTLKLFLLEGSFIAVVGGTLGSLFGMGISYGLIHLILGSNYSAFITLEPLQISWINIVGCIIAALALILIASARPIRKYSKMSVVDNIQYYSEEQETKPKKGKAVWIILILGLLPVFILILQMTGVLSSSSASSSSSSSFGSSSTLGASSASGPSGPPNFSGSGRTFSAFGGGTIIISILEDISTALTWFAPILLTYAIVKILIENSPRRFAAISQKIAKIFSKRTHYLVATNITRKPQRSSRIVIIIAITICFGLMAQIIAQSQTQFEQNQTFLSVGADVKVTGTDTGVGFQTDLYNITNVSSVTTISEITGSLPTSNAQGIRIAGLNVTSLLNTVTLQSEYFYGSNPKTVMNDLQNNTDGALISKSLASDLGVSTGDSLEVQFSESNSTISEDFQIVGYMQVLPGVSSTVGGNYLGDIYTNYAYLNETILPYVSSISYTYLISLNNTSSATSSSVVNTIQTNYGTTIASVTSLNAELATYSTGRSIYEDIIPLMQFQFPFLLIIATFGVLVVTILSILEKRRENALIRVKGVTEKQLVKVQLAEGFVLIVIGVVIGTILGFLMAYFTNAELNNLDPRSATLGLARPFIVPLIPTLLVVIGIPLLFFLITWVASYFEMRGLRVGKIPTILRTY